MFCQYDIPKCRGSMYGNMINTLLIPDNSIVIWEAAGCLNWRKKDIGQLI